MKSRHTHQIPVFLSKLPAFLVDVPLQRFKISLVRAASWSEPNCKTLEYIKIQTAGFVENPRTDGIIWPSTVINQMVKAYWGAE